MISFANPSWLYGLLGLLIPIAIHLLSRKEGKTIWIGSIRHLTDSDTAQFSSIRLNEILLLILRLALITVLVFLLAGFNIEGRSNQVNQWLIIEKGIKQNPTYSAAIDSLNAKGFEVHWLSEGFPDFGDSLAALSPENYFRLIRTIPASVDTAVVMSYNFGSRFNGENISIPKNVFLITVEPEATDKAIAAIDIKPDSIVTRTMKSSASGTSLNYSLLSTSSFGELKKIDSLKVQKRDSIKISIYATEKFEYDRKIVQAALLAISKQNPHLIIVKLATTPAEIASDADFIFWLSQEKHPTGRAKLVGYCACENKNLPVIMAAENSAQLCDTQGFDWAITQRLNEENVLEESFSYSLAKIVLPKFDDQFARSADHRTLPIEVGFSQTNGGERRPDSATGTMRGNEPVLAIILLLLLLAERFIAYHRNQ